jgi:ribosomal protein L7/L12
MTPAQREAVLAALHAGNKIEAIKLCREALGMDLAEAKEYVERLAAEPNLPSADPGKLSAENEAALTEISRLLYAGEKIPAIKFYRERMKTGSGLAEAKEQVERLEAALRASHPEMFTTKPKAGCSALLAVMAVLLIAVAWLLR